MERQNYFNTLTMAGKLQQLRMCRFMARSEFNGVEKLKGKKISLVYHDSPYGKEPIVALEERAKLNGFTFKAIPVTHPGVEQKSQWLAIRQDRPLHGLTL